MISETTLNAIVNVVNLHNNVKTINWKKDNDKIVFYSNEIFLTEITEELFNILDRLFGEEKAAEEILVSLNSEYERNIAKLCQ
jgi:hypothetical protein